MQNDIYFFNFSIYFNFFNKELFLSENEGSVQVIYLSSSEFSFPVHSIQVFFIYIVK